MIKLLEQVRNRLQIGKSTKERRLLTGVTLDEFFCFYVKDSRSQSDLNETQDTNFIV